MGRSVRKATKLFETMQKAGVCGERIEPPREVDIRNMSQLKAWIKANHFTVFHWCSTCKAGVTGVGDVANEKFQVKLQPSATSSPVINNLYIGSAASLPEIPESNPHLSVTEFSVALAEQLLKSHLKRQVKLAIILHLLCWWCLHWYSLKLYDSVLCSYDICYTGLYM